MTHFNNIQRLQCWYKQNCNDEWEHFQGVRIDTVDNPGWKVVVDLKGTLLAGQRFGPLDQKRNDDDWVYCWTESDQFVGTGGPENLDEILGLFLDSYAMH